MVRIIKKIKSMASWKNAVLFNGILDQGRLEAAIVTGNRATMPEIGEMLAALGLMGDRKWGRTLLVGPPLPRCFSMDAWNRLLFQCT
jgi:hypothetical protein